MPRPFDAPCPSCFEAFISLASLCHNGSFIFKILKPFCPLPYFFCTCASQCVFTFFFGGEYLVYQLSLDFLENSRESDTQLNRHPREKCQSQGIPSACHLAHGVGTRDEPLRTSAWEATFTPIVTNLR